MNVKPLSELIDILRREQKMEKYSFVRMKSYKDGSRFKSPKKNPYFDTQNVYVYDKESCYKLTKKTIVSLNVIRSESGKEWPINYIFDKIERKILNIPDLTPYRTNKSYRNCLGNGWYENITLYLKDEIYYGI